MGLADKNYCVDCTWTSDINTIVSQRNCDIIYKWQRGDLTTAEAGNDVVGMME